MTCADYATLTPEQRADNMRRFEALVRLDRMVRRDPRFLSLPPRVRQDEPQSRS